MDASTLVPRQGGFVGALLDRPAHAPFGRPGARDAALARHEPEPAETA